MKISGGDVDAMFRGEAVTRPTRVAASSPDRQLGGHYAKCHNCRQTHPCLWTFGGDKDWSPDLPIDNPIRDAVKALRKHFEVGMILLCDWCVKDLREVTIDVKASAEENATLQTLF